MLYTKTWHEDQNVHFGLSKKWSHYKENIFLPNFITSH